MLVIVVMMWVNHVKNATLLVLYCYTASVANYWSDMLDICCLFRFSPPWHHRSLLTQEKWVFGSSMQNLTWQTMTPPSPNPSFLWSSPLLHIQSPTLTRLRLLTLFLLSNQPFLLWCQGVIFCDTQNGKHSCKNNPAMLLHVRWAGIWNLEKGESLGVVGWDQLKLRMDPPGIAWVGN